MLILLKLLLVFVATYLGSYVQCQIYLIAHHFDASHWKYPCEIQADKNEYLTPTSLKSTLMIVIFFVENNIIT